MLDTSPQGDQLRTAWDEAQAALRDLNSLGRGTGAGVETVLNQVAAASAMRDLPAQLQVRPRTARAANRSPPRRLSGRRRRAQRPGWCAAQSRKRAAAAAQAALDVLDVQIGKLTITAPVDGVVLTLVFQPGEIAAPGALLMVLGQNDDKTITVFIPKTATASFPSARAPRSASICSPG